MQMSISDEVYFSAVYIIQTETLLYTDFPTLLLEHVPEISCLKKNILRKKSLVYQRLTLIWVDFLGIVFRWGRGGKTIPTPHSPLCRLLTPVSSFLRQKLTIN